jgi:hypothetical protein
MIKPYKASAALEALVLNMAPRHHPAPDAPDTWRKLLQWKDTSTPSSSMPVYSGGSYDTIYSHTRYNYAFRAWHDSIHLNIFAGFTRLDEIRVSNEHVRQAKERAVMFGLVDDDFRALRADVAGQVLYYYKYHSYVNNQAEFVGACMANGIFNTLTSEVRY